MNQKNQKMRWFPLLAVLCMTACASVQEMTPPGRKMVLEEPLMKTLTDSARIKQITGRTQSTTENLLSGSVVGENGHYTISISAEDLAELGVSPEEYKEYYSRLNKVNGNE